MAGQFVKNGATLNCPLCSSSGTLVVSHTQIQLQDTPCATNGDRNGSNIVFGGVCNKWRKNKPPCASVISPTQWQGVASGVEIDGELMLVEDSTIGCATGGVDICIADTAQIDVPTDLPDIENTVLKKFLVNFRRSNNYKGEYGFDWLRDEYIYPIETVDLDNTGKPINIPKPLCKDFDKLMQYYKFSDIPDPIRPYGVDYYPAWLSIFADDTYWWSDIFTEEDSIHEEGVMLSIEIEGLEPLINDETKLIFEASNDELTIEPSELSLSNLLGTKETKDLGNGSVKEFYTAINAINISCYRAIEDHEEIKVFAQLKGQREEVGKLMVYKNKEVPVMEIVPVKVIIDDNPPKGLSKNYQNLIEKRFLNQGLIKGNITEEMQFDLRKLPENEFRQLNLKYFSRSNRLQRNHPSDFFEDLGILFEKYGANFSPRGSIEYAANKKTYMLYTNISGSKEGEISATYIPLLKKLFFGNVVTLGESGYTNNDTIKHEIGHSLSLPHIFDKHAILFNEYEFYQGYTDNIMDYDIKFPVSLTNTKPPNKFQKKMYATFKWQWDIMRADRSLVYEDTTIE